MRPIVINLFFAIPNPDPASCSVLPPGRETNPQKESQRRQYSSPPHIGMQPEEHHGIGRWMNELPYARRSNQNTVDQKRDAGKQPDREFAPHILHLCITTPGC